MREKIARVIYDEYLDRHIHFSDEERQHHALHETDAILTLISEEIEKVENPYAGSRDPKHIDYGMSQQPEFGAFEDCRNEILSLLKDGTDIRRT